MLLGCLSQIYVPAKGLSLIQKDFVLSKSDFLNSVSQHHKFVLKYILLLDGMCLQIGFKTPCND